MNVFTISRIMLVRIKTDNEHRNIFTKIPPKRNINGMYIVMKYTELGTSLIIRTCFFLLSRSVAYPVSMWIVYILFVGSFWFWISHKRKHEEWIQGVEIFMGSIRWNWNLKEQSASFCAINHVYIAIVHVQCSMFHGYLTKQIETAIETLEIRIAADFRS